MLNVEKTATPLVAATDVVPPSVREDLGGRADIRVDQVVSNRVIYMHLDSFRDRSPFVTDLQGAVLDRNPLRDPRVRAAMSELPDRKAPRERRAHAAKLARRVRAGRWGREAKPVHPGRQARKARRGRRARPAGFGMSKRRAS